jgi:hypothetical protein
LRGKKGGAKGQEIVTHELWTDHQISGYGHGSDGQGVGWANLRQVVYIRTTKEYLKDGNPKSVEEHYYITSASPKRKRGGPEELMKLARGHWEIENCLHHVKDRSFGEDASRCRSGARLMARLRSLAVGLLVHVEGTYVPMKQIGLSSNPLKALSLLKKRLFA